LHVGVVSSNIMGRHCRGSNPMYFLF
jgi:hypothetical protein